METRLWHFGVVDGEEFQVGPWKYEADKMVWQDEATGLTCLVVRSRLGSWCGYVAVPKGHPFHGCGYDDEPLRDIVIHGGLTFAGESHDGGADQHAISFPGSEGMWMFGFDCAHHLDLTPAAHWTDNSTSPNGEAVYRDITFVRSEVVDLAGQIAKAS